MQLVNSPARHVFYWISRGIVQIDQRDGAALKRARYATFLTALLKSLLDEEAKSTAKKRLQTCDGSVTRVAFADPIIREYGSPGSACLGT
jgi:hypothetical protein